MHNVASLMNLSKDTLARTSQLMGLSNWKTQAIQFFLKPMHPWEQILVLNLAIWRFCIRQIKAIDQICKKEFMGTTFVGPDRHLAKD